MEPVSKGKVPMKPSGANAAEWQIWAILDYLGAAFPGYEVDHVPQPDQWGDLFRVIERSKPVHQLLIRRAFFDDRCEKKEWPAVLTRARAAERMRQAGPEIVELHEEGPSAAR